MKKFALAALGATSMLALAACQADEADPAVTGEEPVATAEPGDGADSTTVDVDGEPTDGGEAATAEGETETDADGEADAEGKTAEGDAATE